MYKTKTLLAFTLGFMFLSLSTLSASQKSALDIINKAFSHSSSLQTYAFKANVSEKEAQADGTFLTYNYSTTVKVNRPGQLRIDSKGKYLDRTMTINNGLYTVMRHDDNTYSQFKVPKNIDDAIEAILHKYELKKAPLASLVYSDISEHIKLHKGSYIASEKVKGVNCDHVRFTLKKRKVDVWVTQSKTPQIVAYHINDSSQQPFINSKTTITWNEKPNISPKDFTFQAPKGSKKVDIVTEDSEE